MTSHDETDGRDKAVRGRIVLLLAVVVAVAVAIVAIFWTRHSRSDAPKPVETVQEQESAPEKLTDTIDIPQFGWINLTADSREQELTFHNPEQNFC